MKKFTNHASSQPRTYGLLVGSIIDGQLDPSGNSPHYEIHVRAGQDYRIAVNVQSDDGSIVVALWDPAFTAPTKLNLPARAAGAPGFTPLATGPGGQGLDYLRDNLFALSQMAPIPDEGAGVTLQNLLDGQIERAKADTGTIVMACGQFFSDGAGSQDATFGFTPALGVHDIHMMQGNGAPHASDNMINGDGALFIRFSSGETVALFVRFATQSLTTDNTSGAPSSPS
jgi:uncharacterized protein YukJ